MIAHERAERLENRHAIRAVRRIHYPFQRIDATEPHLHLLAGELFETLRSLIANLKIVNRPLLLEKLI